MTWWEIGVTHLQGAAMTSENIQQQIYAKRVTDFIERSYGRVMPPTHRDLVKRMVLGETYEAPRPSIHRILRKVANEVSAVVSRG